MEKGISLFDQIREVFAVEEVEAKQYSPLTLAYIGDAVYEIIIRTVLVGYANAPVNMLNKKASSLVKAQAQANLIHALEEDLTEEELAVYKRGRNAKSATTAKNASIKDYRTATGFEALIGYLYMSNQMDRALELVKCGLNKLEEDFRLKK